MVYIRRSPIWPDPRVKPPFGAAEIDLRHSLARGLRFLTIPSGLCALDMVFGIQPIIDPGFTVGVSPYFGRGFDGTGTGRIRYGTSAYPQHRLTMPFTAIMECDTLFNPNFPMIFGRWGTDQSWAWFETNIGLSPRFSIRSAELSKNADYSTVRPGWHVGRWDGANVLVRNYQNGRLIEAVTGDAAVSIDNPADPLTLMNYDNNTINGVRGVLGMCALFDRAWTNVECDWWGYEPYTFLRPKIARRISIPSTIVAIGGVRTFRRMSTNPRVFRRRELAHG